MNQILYQYQLNLTTWIYLSSLLTIALYFKFNRVWSLRNLDLLGLIALAPGLLFVQQPDLELERVGYMMLFSVSAFFMMRLLADPLMVRRPLLEPNLSTGGMTFIAASLMVFLLTNVLTKDLTRDDLEGPRQAEAILSRDAAPDADDEPSFGPTYPLLQVLPSLSIQPFLQSENLAADEMAARAVIVRCTAIVSHLFVVLGMIVIGIRHFDNVRTGIAAATLYLLLPYTAEMTARVHHVLPAALLVWVIAAYRRPMISGMLLGLAAGTMYCYPLFLVPLWASFYWHRGLWRFALGMGTTLAVVIGMVALGSRDWDSFFALLRGMVGWSNLSLEGAQGFWAISQSIAPYRIPVFVSYVVMCVSFALWPAQKNLGTLLSCTAAVLLGTQFWHASRGGIYMDWYLPILLLTIFRPNLEDRVAVSTLGEGWWVRRRSQLRIKAA